MSHAADGGFVDTEPLGNHLECQRLETVDALREKLRLHVKNHLSDSHKGVPAVSDAAEDVACFFIPRLQPFPRFGILFLVLHQFQVMGIHPEAWHILFGEDGVKGTVMHAVSGKLSVFQQPNLNIGDDGVRGIGTRGDGAGGADSGISVGTSRIRR